MLMSARAAKADFFRIHDKQKKNGKRSQPAITFCETGICTAKYSVVELPLPQTVAQLMTHYQGRDTKAFVPLRLEQRLFRERTQARSSVPLELDLVEPQSSSTVIGTLLSWFGATLLFASDCSKL